MRQFAESISRIQGNKERNLFLISFDNSTNYQRVILNKNDYNDLLSYRDNFNCPPITDTFISGNPNINPKNPQRKKNRKSKCSNVSIGKFLLPLYNFCHHCKMLKPPEDLMECQMCNPNADIQKPEIKMKVFFVNQALILKKEKIYMLKNFDGNVRELIDEYFSYKKHNTFFCDKFYCKTCLKLSYNMNIDTIVENSFICPSCRDQCTCSRCFREEQLIKIIACYLTLDGDLDLLYNYLKKQNDILVKNIDSLTMTKFVILNMTESNNKYIRVNKNEFDLNSFTRYKQIVEEYQFFFAKVFDISQKQKLINEYKQELEEKKFLQRKRKDKNKEKNKVSRYDNRNKPIKTQGHFKFHHHPH